MVLVKGLSYFGKKSNSYLERLVQLFPMVNINFIAEICMGSGTFSANCSYKDTERVAIEYDKGMCALNKCIQENVYELVDRLLEQEYSEKAFNDAIKILDEVDSGAEHKEIDVAVAAYISIVESFNSMRDTFRKIKNQESYDKFVDRLRRNIITDLIPLHRAWDGLEIINGNLFDYPEFWLKGKNGLVFCDPPYPQEDRNIKFERKCAGYRQDWKMEMQVKFLNFVVDMNKNIKASHIIICSIADLDENGQLMNIQNKPYCKMLLSNGFRMVVVEKKHTSEIKNENSKSKKKRKKAEIVFLNYDVIRGNWRDFEYYDYEDIYGSEE